MATPTRLDYKVALTTDTEGRMIAPHASYFVIFEDIVYGLVSSENVYEMVRAGSVAKFEVAR
jgi:hypothetical protein